MLSRSRCLTAVTRSQAVGYSMVRMTVVGCLSGSVGPGGSAKSIRWWVSRFRTMIRVPAAACVSLQQRLWRADHTELAALDPALYSEAETHLCEGSLDLSRGRVCLVCTESVPPTIDSCLGESCLPKMPAQENSC